MSGAAAIIVSIGLVLVLILLGAAESALTSVSRARAEAMRDDNVRGSVELLRLFDDRPRMIAPILALALAAQLGLATIIALAVEQRWGARWVPLALAIEIAVLFAVAEALPKIWAVRNIDRSAPMAANVARLIMAVPPVRWIVDGLMFLVRPLLGRTPRTIRSIGSEEELLALTDAAVADEVIEDSESVIIQSLVSFGDTIVREAMVPRPDVISVDVHTTIDEAIVRLVESGHSRMPITGDDRDDVRGIVHIKDLFSRAQRGRGSHFVSIASRQPYFVPETKKAAELLAELRLLPYSMVVVVDEYGGLAGIVTLEDLIEEILGDIVDEFDRDDDPLLEPLQAGEWRVHGRIPVDEFNELLGADLPDDDWDTVGGLIFDALGRVPEAGEVVVAGGYELVVERVQGRRITRVRVRRAGPSDARPEVVAGELADTGAQPSDSEPSDAGSTTG